MMAREMKDSGIEWIGEIPCEWNISQFKKTFLSTNSGEVIDKNWWNTGDNVLYTCQRTPMMSNFVSFPDEKRTRNGDLLLTRNATPYVFIPVNNAIYSNVVQRVQMDTAYYDLKYVSYSLKQAADAYGIAAGISIPSYNMKIWGDLRIPIPDIAEQSRIAAFLDRKCAEIDSVIADTQRAIEEYKALKQSIITEAVTKGVRGKRPMKDSGIEWIGEIPDDWAIEKGKHILEKLERPVNPDDGVITCFRDGEVTLRSNRREDGFTFSLQEAGYQGINVGDLVVHGMDGFAGAIGISDSRGKGTPVLNVLDSTQHKRYIMYYLRNMAINGVFLALATGIRVRSCDTNWNKLKELPYILPSLEEQREIAQYIDLQLNRLDELIMKKQSLLSELESYKKSVIYEYVTGKKEVPACQ